MHTEASVKLRGELIRSLKSIYALDAFGALANLMQGESLVLNYLLECRGKPVNPSALSEGLHLSRSRITGALNSLRRKGWIETVPSSEDHRRLQVFITDAGAAQISGQLAEMSAYFDQMIAGLGADDAAELIHLMNRCVDVMEA
jgi:DNA-binding MarR family transcriptional regulator